MKKVGIIDYGLSNIGSVYNAIIEIGHEPFICQDGKELKKYDYLILPGVGSFDEGMKGLKERGFIEGINNHIKKELNFLGICLGAQLMCSKSEEGVSKGLNIFREYEVVKFKVDLPLPHMGWNWVKSKGKKFNLNCRRFYFVHTYHFQSDLKKSDLWYSNYKYDFPCLIGKNNTFAAQFHPEKSLDFGLSFLNSFMNGKIE